MQSAGMVLYILKLGLLSVVPYSFQMVGEPCRKVPACPNPAQPKGHSCSSTVCHRAQVECSGGEEYDVHFWTLDTLGSPMG